MLFEAGVTLLDYRSLSYSLGILRLIQNSGDPNRSTAEHIRTWANVSSNVSISGVLKVASYVVEQVEEAHRVIDLSQLSQEAKHGVQESLSAMMTAFSLNGIHSPPSSHIKNIPAAISNLVILLSAAGIDTEGSAPPPEAVELATEIEELLKEFDNGALDPILRDVARRHLQILATMLRHVDVFGLEAALATYFDLVFKVRRADTNTSKEQKEAAKPLLEQIDGFQKKLGVLDKAWNQGARWVARAKGAAALLSFFGSPG